MPGITYATTATFAEYELRDAPSTAGALWSALAEDAGLREEIAVAAREVVAGETRLEARQTLAEIVDTEATNLVPMLLASFGDDVHSDAFWKAFDTIPSLASGRPAGFDPGATHAFIRQLLAVLEAADIVPTVAITLPEEFRDRDRSTRSAWLQFVATLSRQCDVRLITSRVDRAWLAEHHRDDLPGVSERTNATLDEDALAAAATLVDVGSRHERILTHLAEQDTATDTYTRLYATYSVSRGRIRQVIGDLADYDLVEVYGPNESRRVELTKTGSQFVEGEIARQRRLADRVSAEPNPNNKGSVTSACTWEGADRPDAAQQDRPDRNRLPPGHETRYMSRLDAAAALGSATETGISVLNYPVAFQDDRAEGRFHAEGDRVVAACEGDNPLQVWTTLALTVASPRMFDEVLTRSRCEDHDVCDMLENGKTVLRGMRNIGWIDEDVEDYDDLREELLGAARELGDLTSTLHEKQEDGEEDLPLRKTVLKHALGLATSITHLLDLVDVELVRVLKIPEYTRRYHDGDAESLWRTIAIGTALGASYGHHVSWRQLFEDREGKRRQAFDVTIDAADPVAQDSGSWVVVGDFGDRSDRVADRISQQFDDLSPHEDAPSMQVRASVRTDPSRRQVATAAQQVLSQKGLQLTPEATSMLHGLCRTPYDVVDALSSLAGDNEERRIDASEVRFALSSLEPSRLLRGYSQRTRAPRKLVAALLATDAPVRAAELDELADISDTSRRAHLSDLLEVGLVEETAQGYRLALSFDGLDDEDEHAERLVDRYPTWVADPEQNDVHAAAKALRVGRQHHGPGDPVTDPGWPYNGFSEPPDLRALHHPEPLIDHILPALWAIRQREEYCDDPEILVTTARTATAGPELKQTPLPDETNDTEVRNAA